MEKSTLSDLQKENFNLKMQLFHLEEMVNKASLKNAKEEEEEEHAGVIASLQKQLKERDSVLANAKNIVIALREELQVTSERLEETTLKLEDANQKLHHQEKQMEQLYAALKNKQEEEEEEEEKEDFNKKKMDLLSSMVADWHSLSRKLLKQGENVVLLKKKTNGRKQQEDEDEDNEMKKAEHSMLLKATEALFTDLLHSEQQNEMLKSESSLQQSKHLHALQRVEAAENLLNLCAEKMTNLDLNRKNKKRSPASSSPFVSNNNALKSGGSTTMKRMVGSLQQKAI